MGAELSFELDAGKILAKLHRGGCQTHEKKAIFINTGITDDANINPELVDKNKINFDMEGGEYEVGVVFIDIPKGIDPKKLDLMSNEEGEEEDSSEEDTKKKEDLDKKTPITDNPDEKKTNESLISEDYTKTDPNKNPIEMDIIGDMLSNPKVEDFKEIDAKAKNAPAEAKDAIKNNSDIVKKAMETNMKFACRYLKNYMLAFAGSDATKIDPKDVQVTYIPDKFADPYKNKKYDKYQIPALSDAETRERKVQIIKDLRAGKLKPEDIFKNMCFKVAYTLDIGK